MTEKRTYSLSYCEKFPGSVNIHIHDMTEAELKDLAKQFGAEIRAIKNGDGSYFLALDVTVGPVEITFFS